MPELRSKGLAVAVITYDSMAILADFSRRRGITFPLLSDQGSATIKSYGLLNTTVDAASTNYGIPFPGTFLVNRQGVVTARFFEEAYQERNTVASILLKLGYPGHEIDVQRISTEHVEVTTYLSDQVVAPGTLFSIVVDVTPRPGMHVYAPGQHSYKVIALRLDAQPLPAGASPSISCVGDLRVQAAERTGRSIPKALPAGSERRAQRFA